ncbi:MAG: hypothetical protein NVS3B21_25720 [Acidimicrobiales bacterium]
MTPTLQGRLQTRVLLLLTIGLAWTLLISPALPRPAFASLGMVYRITLKAIVVVGVVGIGWELLYHGLQQFRWDKDWPSLFGLLTSIPEAVVAWIVLHALHIIPGTYGWESPIRNLFMVHFFSTWLILWLFMQGPLRVVAIRWRFEGGRFI